MWCNKYISIPFKNRGRSEDGVDCWGLVRLIYKKERKIDLPELLTYTSTDNKNEIFKTYEEYHKFWKSIEIGNQIRYDVMVFKMFGFPCHVAVVIDKNYMIHCEKGMGTHITEYNKEYYWQKHLVGIYRYDTCSNVIASV